jgi:hypothetical protein
MSAPDLVPTEMDEKMVNTEVDPENNDSGREDGHIQELEVDMDVILKDGGEENYAGDHSPYPEGTSSQKLDN